MATKEIKDFSAVVTPAAADLFVTQQASDSVTRKATATQLVGSAAPKAHTHVEADVTDLVHTDADAVHDNVAGEFAALTAKSAPVDADILLIEDSAASNAKKKMLMSTLMDLLTPAGLISPYIGTSAPTGWLLCDGSSVSATTYTDLFDVLKAQVADWGLSTKVGDVTTDFGTDDKIDLTSHGFSDADVVHFSNTGGALPAGLSVATKYYVINKTANDFEVSLTSGGAAVDITGDGTGTHHVHNQFVVPDLRGRQPLGKDDMGGSSANRVTATQADNIGQASGLEDSTAAGTVGGTAVSTAQLAVHSHTPRAFTSGTGGTNDIGVGTQDAGPVSVDRTTTDTGSGSTHTHSFTGSAADAMNPYQTMNYIVKT